MFNCGKYGTFMCNSQQERVEANLKISSISIWLDINHQDLSNPCYMPSKIERKLRIEHTDYYKLKVWIEYFEDKQVVDEEIYDLIRLN